MQKFIIVNDNEVSYRNFSDEELVTLALNVPDTAFLTPPFGVVSRLVNKFTSTYSDFIRETMFDYNYPSLVRVFVSAVNENNQIVTKLGIIEDGEGRLEELQTLEATPENANVFVRMLYSFLETLSCKYTSVEVYADGTLPLYKTVKQAVMLEYSKPNLTLYSVTKNGLAKRLIENPVRVCIDWCYLSPQSLTFDEPDYSKDKTAYTKHIKQLSKEIRDRIFAKYDEVMETLDTPQVVVTEFDTIEVVEEEEIPIETTSVEETSILSEEVVEDMWDTVGIQGIPLEDVETVVEVEAVINNEEEDDRPISIEIKREAIAQLDSTPIETVNLEESADELRQAKLRINILERQLADSEELHKLEVDSLKAKLASYESATDNLAERKVNDIEIERLTEQLVRLTQVELKYKELVITHEELLAEHASVREEYVKMQVDIVNLQHENSKNSLELEEYKERVISLNNQLLQDSNLMSVLNKLGVIEMLVNRIDTRVSQSNVVVASTSCEMEMPNIEELTNEIDTINNKAYEIMNADVEKRDTLNDGALTMKYAEDYGITQEERDALGSDFLSEAPEIPELLELDDKVPVEEEEVVVESLPEPNTESEEQILVSEEDLPSFDELEGELIEPESEEEYQTFNEFFDGSASLTDYLKTKTSI